MEFEERHKETERAFERKLKEKDRECLLVVEEKVQENIRFSADLHKEFLELEDKHRLQMELMQAKVEEI